MTPPKSLRASAPSVRIGVVLSCGGLRGAAHLGVLNGLLAAEIPIDVMVGVSAGAIIAAYYAGVGLTADEMIEDAPAFKGRHLIMHGVTIRARQRFKPFLRTYCGVIPRRLAQLEAARFDSLHHGVTALGIVCHDVEANRPFYFSTSNHHGVRLCDIVKASAAIPIILPSAVVTIGDRRVRLADGGLSDSLPIEFARSCDLGATHLIVSDCRMRSQPAADDRLAYIKPALDGIGSFCAPRATLMAAVRAGEASVTPDIVARIKSWSSADPRPLQRVDHVAHEVVLHGALEALVVPAAS